MLITIDCKANFSFWSCLFPGPYNDEIVSPMIGYIILHTSLIPNLFKALVKLSNFLKYFYLHIFLCQREECGRETLFAFVFGLDYVTASKLLAALTSQHKVSSGLICGTTAWTHAAPHPQPTPSSNPLLANRD